jgi:hypothetical protein
VCGHSLLIASLTLTTVQHNPVSHPLGMSALSATAPAMNHNPYLNGSFVLTMQNGQIQRPPGILSPTMALSLVEQLEQVKEKVLASTGGPITEAKLVYHAGPPTDTNQSAMLPSDRPFTY